MALPTLQPVIHNAPHHTVNDPRLVGVAYWSPSRLQVDNIEVFPFAGVGGEVVMFSPGYSSFMIIGGYQADIAGALSGIQVSYFLHEPVDNTLPAMIGQTVTTWPPTFALTRQKVSFGIGQVGGWPSPAHGFVRFSLSFFNTDDTVTYTLTARLYASGRR